MQIYRVESQPHTYIVENGYGKQLGTVDEFHNHNHNANGENETVSYIATRFFGHGIFEQEDFSGFTAALQFAGKR